MCGIAGVVSADQRLVEPAVRSMMRAMVHRGLQSYSCPISVKQS